MSGVTVYESVPLLYNRFTACLIEQLYKRNLLINQYNKTVDVFGLRRPI